MKLILASSSPYRRALLTRLRLPFEVCAPHVAETPQDSESALSLAERLAKSKAQAIASKYDDALIIGCDQTASLHGQLIGKPESHQAAVEQLRAMRGNSVIFYSAICVLQSKTAETKSDVAESVVTFSNISDEQIERYLLLEQPYDCTGSAKIEGLGIALVRGIQASDPTAIIGLPLISLIRILGGFDVYII
jgi:septum formation protein